jgi:hypothetical protein
MTPDRTTAESFLKALDPSTDRFTFQTFDDVEERKEKRKDTGEKDPFAKIRHGTLAQHWRELVKLNEQGAGIFVTVNRTDFKGRAETNIKAIRAVFADLDGSPLEPVLADGVPKPHITLKRRPVAGMPTGVSRTIYRLAVSRRCKRRSPPASTAM